MGFLGTFFIQLLVGVTLMVISYLITPKPKREKPEPARDLELPTAEAGRPVPVVFGTMTVKGGNVLWRGDRRKREYTVNS